MISNEKNGCLALEVFNLTKEFADPYVKAVDQISFQIGKGEIFSLLGPNGAGKSTTINVLATQIDATSGSVKIFGKDIKSEQAAVRRLIGVCPQEIVIYENLTVLENVLFFGSMNNTPLEDLKLTAEYLIDRIGLKEKKNSVASKLSGGMKRRLNVILALLNESQLVILDEPTAGLDPQTRRMVWDFILELKNKGKTILLTTHYMDEADFLSDRVAIIDHGKIIAMDTPFELKKKYSSGDTVELKFYEEYRIVHAILSKAIGQYIKNLEYVEDQTLFRLYLNNGLNSLFELLEQIKKGGLNLESMNLRGNSLENVFLSLTGRQIRE